MAKTGFWLRNAKGKLAGATIYQQNGETVMREVVSPSNPKTERQILQRIIMHTVMQSYSKMKEICDHSFEGIKKGQDTMAYFMKQNVQFAREKVAQMQADGTDFYDIYNFVPLGMKGYTPNQYQVAMGSLPSITATLPNEDDAEINKVLIPAITKQNPTYQDVADALGLQRGDQLTFLIIKAAVNQNSFGQNEFMFARVILDPIDPETHLQLPMSTAFLASAGAINAPSFRNENSSNFAFAYSSTDNCLKFGSAASAKIGAACVIASRQYNSNWLRSTTYMTYRGNFGQTYSLGDCMDMAAQGANSTIYAPSEQYLNNAGTGGGQAAATGENSDAGQGGNSGNSGGNTGGGTNTEFAITSVSAGSSPLTAGTNVSLGFESLPASVEVRVHATNIPTGASVSLKDSNSASAEDVATANFNSSGQATMSEELGAGTYYIYYNLGSGSVASGYSFGVKVSQSGGFEPGS